MCSNATAAAHPANKQENKGSFCRWILGGQKSRDLLTAGEPAGLFVSAHLKGGRREEAGYVVYREACGWRMLKEVKGKVVESHLLDTTFDEDPWLWICTCKDALYRGQNCKHKRALIQGLKAIGILAV